MFLIKKRLFQTKSGAISKKETNNLELSFFLPIFATSYNNKMTTDHMHQLALMKMKFIEQIVSEHSLDTLREWFSMYEEARYVASLNSDEEELKEFRNQFEESIRNGFVRKRNNNVEP